MNKPILTKVLTLFIVCFITISLSAQVRYVKPGGSGSGTSWTSAYSDLQDALDDVMAGSADEIRILEGTYQPKESPDGSSDHKKYAFHLNKDCKIKGGYVYKSGNRWVPPSYNQKGITTLSGDLAFTESEDSAYHIFLTHDLTSATEITRIKFTGAKADGTDTTFFSGQNYYSQFGGGMYNISSSPTLNLHISGFVNFGFVSFDGNLSTGDAAGMYNTQSSPKLVAVQFLDNHASRDGGGLYNKDQSSPEVSFCVFEGNVAGNFGGGIINNNSCSPSISKTLFENNYAGKRGGGLYNWSSCNPVMINNAFEENESGQVGGAIASYQSSPEITNAVFYNNSAEYGGAIASMYQCGSKITNSTFFDNEATKTNGGGALYAVTSWPTLNNSAFYDNSNNDVLKVSSYVFGTHNASDYGTSSGVNIGSGFVNLSGWDDDDVFRNPSDPDGPLGYFLFGAGLSPSPCGPLVGAGLNSEIPSGVTTEMRGTIFPYPRLVGDIVDIGAYEMRIESGCDLPTTPGIHTSTDVIEQEGFSYFVDCDKEELIIALDLEGTGAVIPDDGASVKVGNETTISWIDSGGLISNTKGGAMIDRRWNVDPTTQPTSPVTVRSYFTEQEYQDLVDTLANHNNGTAGYAYLITDPTVMSMYKINSSTPYLTPHDAGINGVILSNSSSPTTTTWVYDSLENAHVAEFQVSSFSGGGGGNGGGTGALPVDLIEFEAITFGPQTAKLNWTTASELNNSHFVVERSYDAQNFEEIDIVEGNGTSNELLDYTYIDNTVDNSISVAYYRLRQVDYDGQEELSIIRDVNFDKIKISESVTVYPNPFRNVVNVNVTNKAAKRFTISVSSLNGTEVYLKQGYNNSGSVSIDLSEFKVGVYVLGITTNNEVNYVKITKM